MTRQGNRTIVTGTVDDRVASKFERAVMFAEPSETPVTSPLGLTVAIV